MRKLLVPCMVALLVAGCGGATLTKAGERVAVSPEADVSGCEFVGLFEAEYGGNFKGTNENYRNATNDVRNQAASAGATHVVIGAAGRDRNQVNFATAMGGTGQCNNCVNVVASGYRCE